MSDDKPLEINEVYAYLRVHDSAAALDFYARAFDAKELFRLTAADGKIGHAQTRIGPVTVMSLPSNTAPAAELRLVGIAGPSDHAFVAKS